MIMEPRKRHQQRDMIERLVEEIKEMSLNNFESTMDNISDNELGSLEQELEELVGIAELNVAGSTETAVKKLEDSIEKVEEVKEIETPTAVIDVALEITETEASESPTVKEDPVEEV
jgi:hypothetical protein